MESAINSLFVIILVFFLAFIIVDIEKAEMVKQHVYLSAKAASQNSLLELKNEKIDSEEMLESWIRNFSVNNLVSLEDIELEFYIVNTDPECYLVKVKGYNNSAFISTQIYTEYITGTMIISK